MCLGSSLRKEYLGLHFDVDRSRSQSQLIMIPMTPPYPEVGTEMVSGRTHKTFRSPEAVCGVHILMLGYLVSALLLSHEWTLAASCVTRRQ